MQITIRLDSAHVDRLADKALAGSLAKETLSKLIDNGDEQATRTIICELPAAEALQRLAVVHCTPALTIIQEAIRGSGADPAPARTRPRRR